MTKQLIVNANTMKEGELMATISVRIDDAEKEALQKIAQEKDVAISWLVRQLIKDYLKKD